MGWFKKNKHLISRMDYLPPGFNAAECMKAFRDGWATVDAAAREQEIDTSHVQTGKRTEIEVRMGDLLHKLSHQRYRPVVPERMVGTELLHQCLKAVRAVDCERLMGKEFYGCKDFLRTRLLVKAASWFNRTGGVPGSIKDLLELAVLDCRLANDAEKWDRWGSKIATEKNLDQWVEDAEKAFPQFAKVCKELDAALAEHRPATYKAFAIAKLLEEMQQDEQQEGEGPPGEGEGEGQNPGEPQPGKLPLGRGSCCCDKSKKVDEEAIGDARSTLTTCDLEDGAGDRPTRQQWGVGGRASDTKAIDKAAYQQSKRFFGKAIELMLETQDANRMIRPEAVGRKFRSRRWANCYTDGKVFAVKEKAPGELLNMAVLLDRSGSIHHVFSQMAGMVKGLLESVEQYQGEARLWMFGDTVSGMLSNDRIPLGTNLVVEGGTYCSKAIESSNEWIVKQQGRRACVIVTDGRWGDYGDCSRSMRQGRSQGVEYYVFGFGQKRKDGDGFRDIYTEIHGRTMKALPAHVSYALGSTVPEIAAAALRCMRAR